MKDFFSSLFFKIVVAFLVISLGASVYTFGFSGATSGSTNITGIILSPIQKGVSNASIFLSNIYSKSFEYDDALIENELLKQQISELETKAREHDYVLAENEHLKTMLNIVDTHRDFELEICEVVGRDFSNTSSILTLDKGANAGLKVSDCVITYDGLVGYISKVGFNYAQVTTVYDPTFSLGSIVTQTRELSVLQGSLELSTKNQFRASYFDKNDLVDVGHTIETSGITGSSPKGILVGTVCEIQIDVNGISKHAIIESFLDIEEINKVYIIKSF